MAAGFETFLAWAALAAEPAAHNTKDGGQRDDDDDESNDDTSGRLLLFCGRTLFAIAFLYAALIKTRGAVAAPYDISVRAGAIAVRAARANL